MSVGGEAGGGESARKPMPWRWQLDAPGDPASAETLAKDVTHALAEARAAGDAMHKVRAGDSKAQWPSASGSQRTTTTTTTTTS